MSLEEVLKIVNAIDLSKFYKFRIGSKEIKLRMRNDDDIEIELGKGLLFTYIILKYKTKTMALQRSFNCSFNNELKKFYNNVDEKLRLEEKESNERQCKQIKLDNERENQEFEKLKLELKLKLQPEFK